ncbi:hypothetical protein ACHAWX_003236 [Stephanocyclus meneghinianus]
MELVKDDDRNGSVVDVGAISDATGNQTKITLTNPGIISRLHQDINGYLSLFGYRLRFSTQSSPSKGGINTVTAVLTVPLLSNSSSIKTLHIFNHDENLMPTIGPLIRTYLRLSDVRLHPKKLRAIVDCQFIIRPKDKITDTLEQTVAKRMAHHIHMLIRNSMGSALCLDLAVVLPGYSCENRSLTTLAIMHAMEDNSDACYPCVKLRERDSAEFNDTSNDLESLKKCNLSRDGNTLYLHIRSRMCTVRHQPILFRWLYTSSLPSLPVTRSAVSDKTIKGDSLTQQSKSPVSQSLSPVQPPIVIACIEKVANLHRILMLCFEYDKDHSVKEKFFSLNDDAKDVSSLFSNSSLLLLNVIVVMPRETIETRKNAENNIVCGSDSITPKTNVSMAEVNSNRMAHKSLLEYYEEAIHHFHSVVFGKNKNVYNFYRPKLIYEDEAIKSILPILSKTQQLTANANDVMQPTIVGIDLHPDALTLSGDYELCQNSQSLSMHCPSGFKHTQLALEKLKGAHAIVFGYESLGIPPCIRECPLLTTWVQIPCRSSINVVAAMSIILDALLGQKEATHVSALDMPHSP